MSNYAIKIEGLSKRYRIGRKMRYRTLRDELHRTVNNLLKKSKNKEYDPRLRGWRQDAPFVWALKDVSVEIPAGSSMGIIGSNGAGKTTLLKILAHITAPTEGRVRLRGRVGSLLEVGTGFHPELTGRENVYLNGAILGMRKQEIDRKFDEIVAFSEIEQYLDTPVKFYSSGMGVRLAFSVAAHLEPEILLLDEVLAVGDMNFQKKSLNKMGDVVRSGRTVLFVSHNLAAVKALCQSAIFIEHGQVKYVGEVDGAINAYLDSGELQSVQQVERKANERLAAQIMSVGVMDHKGEPAVRVPHDQPFLLNIRVAVRDKVEQLFPTVHILDSDLAPLISSNHFNADDEDGLTDYLPGNYTFQVRVPASLLAPGNYRLSVTLSQRKTRRVRITDRVEHVCPFDVYDNGSTLARYNIQWSGKLSIPLEWKCSQDH
jgi:lipopolysaccharide transport system ATP-binding protein